VPSLLTVNKSRDQEQPLGEGQARRDLAIERRASAVGEPLPIVMVVTVGPRYFETCDVDIRRGRDFRQRRVSKEDCAMRPG
jgi:hypothetical protein